MNGAPPVRVAVSSSSRLLSHLGRQSPGGSWRWGDVQFVPAPVAAETGADVDAWVVYEGVEVVSTLRCPPENVFFVSGEPPSVRRDYDRRFLDQFSVLFGAREFPGRRAIRTQPMLSWHFGWDPERGTTTATYDSLRSLRWSDVPKSLVLSSVTSGKSFTVGHRRRVRLVEELQHRYGSSGEVVFRGRDSDPIDDKAEVILPARYHLAIENCREDDYWTEKLVDAFLGWSVPLYIGAPNLAGYFPSESFVDLGSLELDAALDRIASAIAAAPDDEVVEAMAAARELVLDTYNFFPAMARHVAEHRETTRRETIRIERMRRPPLVRAGGRVKRAILAGIGR